MATVRVARAADVPEGQARVFEVDGHTVAVYNVSGAFYATDNACPHRGGPLGDGDLVGPYAVCPWHGWRWDVTTGAHANNPAVKVACFPVSLTDGEILVELP
jgi:nitrite reductase (NADH) small subunit